MSTVKEHYDGMLGPVYSWILGDFESAYKLNHALFERLEISAGANALAVDLGSGPGCQSIPLAELGFEVIAVDFCQTLLDELRERAGDLPIRTACDDIFNFANHLDAPADLIVCMGDTLCHLPNMTAVTRLLHEVAGNLAPGGKFIASFRDYVSAQPAGADRFVPVRSSDDRIFTCFVEFRDDVVHISDILYYRIDGEWKLEVSEYDKIKVDPRDVMNLLQAKGTRVRQHSDNGMIVIEANMRP